MTKKQKIKKLIFDNSVRNSAFIYQLFINNKLNVFIKKIVPKHIIPTEKSLIKKKSISAEEQFILTLDYFITYFNNYFYFIRYSNIVIILPLLLKSKYCNEIFLSSFYKGDNSKGEYYINSFKKIIIDSFVHNLIYLYSNLKFKCKISIKDIDLNNPEIVNQLFIFLLDIVYCNNEIMDVYFLFENIDDYKEKLLKQKKDINKVNLIALNYYKVKWDNCLENYYKRIKYVRKIKNN